MANRPTEEPPPTEEPGKDDRTRESVANQSKLKIERQRLTVDKHPISSLQTSLDGQALMGRRPSETDPSGLLE